MKELTIKEKAKAYDKALERAINLHKDAIDMGENIRAKQCEVIFPELAMSEENKIRKDLIEWFDDFPDIIWRGHYKKDAIAWLEKQGESDETKAKMFLINKGYPIDANGRFPTYEEIYEIIKEGLEKQGNQKPYGQRKECLDCQFNYAGECKGSCPIKEMHKKSTSNTNHNWYVSKVDGKIYDLNYVPEPKFKIGDWITNKGHSYLIADIDYEQRRYLFEVGGYTHEQLNWEYIENADNKYHLWTIEDAKDGDVLIDKSHVGECVFIFKEARPSDIKTNVNNPLAIIGYCGINHIGFTSQLSGLGFGDTVNCIYYPATKEQRNLLFSKMKEAGYEWDAEKKELKKIEQKPAWSEEDERICQCLIEDQEEALDKVEVISNLKKMYEERIEWLKSLKERIGG